MLSVGDKRMWWYFFFKDWPADYEFDQVSIHDSMDTFELFFNSLIKMKFKNLSFAPNNEFRHLTKVTVWRQSEVFLGFSNSSRIVRDHH